MDDDLDLAIAAWNAGKFADAADRLEEVWAGEVGARRDCLRGLIHAAMGLHYAGVGDADSARSKLKTAQRLLAAAPSEGLGMDLESLRSAVAEILTRSTRDRTQRDPSDVLRGVLLPRWNARPTS